MEGDPSPIVRVLRQTYLSRKPPRNPKPLVFFSLALIFAVSYAYWHSPGPELFPLVATPELVFGHHEWWRAFTTLFVHSDPEHFFANSLMFGVLAYLLNGYFGPFLFPFMALLFGGLTNLVILPTYSSYTSLVGASGVVYWMSGFWLVMYFGLDRRYSVADRGVRCLGFALATLFPSTIKPEVSYRTHAAGFVLGVCFGLVYFFLTKAKYRKAEAYDWE